MKLPRVASLSPKPANLGETRRVAVYLETHYNIGLKGVFPTAYSTGDTTVYVFTDAQPV